MKAKIAEIKSIADNIDGFLGSREGPVLYDLARKCSRTGSIVEIGSWKGKSTIWLGKGSKSGNGATIYAIDPHTGSNEHKEKYGKVWTFEQFKQNITSAEVDDVIIPILGTSEEASKNLDQPVELIFIDGAHDYDSVKLDFEVWFPKIIDGGIVAFHDRQWPGVRKVIEESVLKSRNFKNVKLVRNTSLVLAEKTARNSVGDLVRNRCLVSLLRLDFRSRVRRMKKSIRNIRKGI